MNDKQGSKAKQTRTAKRTELGLPNSEHKRTMSSQHVRGVLETAANTVANGPDGRHWISCPHGLRLQRSVHHPVRDTLAWLLTAVLGERMVIRETPDGGGRMGSFMRRFPGLGHQPDIVLEGFDGRDSYTRSWRSRRVSPPETPAHGHLAGRGAPPPRADPRA